MLGHIARRFGHQMSNGLKGMNLPHVLTKETHRHLQSPFQTICPVSVWVRTCFVLKGILYYNVLHFAFCWMFAKTNFKWTFGFKDFFFCNVSLVSRWCRCGPSQESRRTSVSQTLRGVQRWWDFTSIIMHCVMQKTKTEKKREGHGGSCPATTAPSNMPQVSDSYVTLAGQQNQS